MLCKQVPCPDGTSRAKRGAGSKCGRIRMLRPRADQKWLWPDHSSGLRFAPVLSRREKRRENRRTERHHALTIIASPLSTSLSDTKQNRPCARVYLWLDRRDGRHRAITEAPGPVSPGLHDPRAKCAPAPRGLQPRVHESHHTSTRPLPVLRSRHLRLGVGVLLSKHAEPMQTNTPQATTSAFSLPSSSTPAGSPSSTTPPLSKRVS